VSHQHEPVGRHDLSGRAALNLVKGEPNRHATVEQQAGVGEDGPKCGDGPVGVAALDKKPRLIRGRVGRS
jgi:hypothetical protein